MNQVVCNGYGSIAHMRRAEKSCKQCKQALICDTMRSGCKRGKERVIPNSLEDVGKLLGKLK